MFEIGSDLPEIELYRNTLPKEERAILHRLGNNSISTNKL